MKRSVNRRSAAQFVMSPSHQGFTPHQGLHRTRGYTAPGVSPLATVGRRSAAANASCPIGPGVTPHQRLHPWLPSVAAPRLQRQRRRAPTEGRQGPHPPPLCRKAGGGEKNDRAVARTPVTSLAASSLLSRNEQRRHNNP